MISLSLHMALVVRHYGLIRPVDLYNIIEQERGGREPRTQIISTANNQERRSVLVKKNKGKRSRELWMVTQHGRNLVEIGERKAITRRNKQRVKNKMKPKPVLSSQQIKQRVMDSWLTSRRV